MKIFYHLPWTKPFKFSAYDEAFAEYLKRTLHFAPCQIFPKKSSEAPRVGLQTWLCDRSPRAKILSSENVAERLEKSLNSGIRELHIWVGDADGFSEPEIQKIAPDLRWSFGPMTLPHELAAVVAAEQIYRAFTILNNLPYHGGH